MKRVRTYQRSVEEARAALEKYPLVITRGDRASMSLAIGLLEDLTVELPAIKQRDKARRERIDWIEAPGGVMVARVGRGWAHYWGSLRRVCIYRADGSKVAQFDANSTRSATRKIRAWRKRK